MTAVSAGARLGGPARPRARTGGAKQLRDTEHQAEQRDTKYRTQRARPCGIEFELPP